MTSLHGSCAPCLPALLLPPRCRERAAEALKGILTVAAVDADAHRELGSQVGARFCSVAQRGSLRPLL